MAYLALSASFEYLCYSHYKYFNSFSVGNVFRRQYLTSTDVKRLKSIPALNGLRYTWLLYSYCSHIYDEMFMIYFVTSHNFIDISTYNKSLRNASMTKVKCMFQYLALLYIMIMYFTLHTI